MTIDDDLEARTIFKAYLGMHVNGEWISRNKDISESLYKEVFDGLIAQHEAELSIDPETIEVQESETPFRIQTRYTDQSLSDEGREAQLTGRKRKRTYPPDLDLDQYKIFAMPCEVVKTSDALRHPDEETRQGWSEAIKAETRGLIDIDKVLEVVSASEPRPGIDDIIPAMVICELKPPDGEGNRRKKGRIVGCGNFQCGGGKESFASTVAADLWTLIVRDLSLIDMTTLIVRDTLAPGELPPRRACR